MRNMVRYYWLLSVGMILIHIIMPVPDILKAFTTGTNYTLLEKIRKSQSIIFAKFIEVGDKEFEIFYMPLNSYVTVKVPKYGYYEVMDVMKGNFNQDTLIVDFQKINSRYKPSSSTGIVTPNDSGIVLFMFEEYGYTFKGNQGKISIKSSKYELYKESVALSIELDLIDESLKLDKVIEYISTKPLLMRSMIRELSHFDNNKFGIKISSLLYNDDPVIRQLTLLSLRGTRIKSLVPVIIKLSQDNSPYVRREAVIVLGYMEDDEAENALRNLTKDSSYEVRNIALNYLPKATENLKFFIIAISDPSDRVRRTAADALKRMESIESTDAMIAILNGRDRISKKPAMDVLSSYGTAESISAITVLLTDIDKITQFNASMAILRAARHHPEIAKDPKMINNILRIVDETESRRNKMAGIRLLGKLSLKEALPMLKKNLIHEDPKIRIISARAIAGMREVSLIEYMENILENEKDKNVEKQLKRSISSLRSTNLRSKK